MGCSAEVEQELADLRADYAEVRKALRALLTGAQSYELDTGQTRQRVTRADLDALRLMRRDLLSEIRQLEAECSGGRTTRVVPGF